MRKLIRVLPALALLVAGLVGAGPAHASATNVTSFQNVGTGLCMEVGGYSGANGAQVQQWGCNGGTNQQWVVWYLGGGYYEIVNHASGKCLELPGNPPPGDFGVHLQQWDCNNGRNQLWVLGDWTATNGKNARALEAVNWNCAEIPGNPGTGVWGTAVQQWGCNRGPNQLWWTDYDFQF